MLDAHAEHWLLNAVFEQHFLVAVFAERSELGNDFVSTHRRSEFRLANPYACNTFTKQCTCGRGRKFHTKPGPSSRQKCQRTLSLAPSSL